MAADQASKAAPARGQAATAARAASGRGEAVGTPAPAKARVGSGHRARTFAQVVQELGFLVEEGGRDSAKREAPVVVDDYMELDGHEEEPGPAAKIRYWKARRAAAAQAGMEDDVAECDMALAAVAAQAKANRPWEARLQAASQRHAKAMAALEQAKANLEAAEAVRASMQRAHSSAQEDERAAGQELASIKAEVVVVDTVLPGPAAQEETTIEGLIGKLMALARQAGLDAQALSRMVAEVPGQSSHGCDASQPIPAAQGTPLAVAFSAGARRSPNPSERRAASAKDPEHARSRSREPGGGPGGGPTE